MKTEDNSQTPSTSYATAQWSTATSQIPIDPALQQQSQQPPNPATYYQQYYQQYQHQYQHYVPPQPAAQPAPVATPKPVTAAAPPPATIDTTDVSKLNDALGSAGVDLRAEEETLQRSFDQYHSYRPYEDRSRKQPASPNFDVRYLGPKIRELGTKHKIAKIPDDSVNYIALALRFRLQELLEGMIAAAAQRTEGQFDRPPAFYEDGTPMWSVVVRADVGKQLAAIERVEREEEMKVRRERKEREEAAKTHAQQLAAQTSSAVSSADAGDAAEEGPKKKKKKADGPGVTARNMSEDVRKKMSNAVASQAAGLSTTKYAWMNASAAAAPPPKPKAAASGTLTPATTTAPAASGGGGGAGSSWARPYVLAGKNSQSPVTKEEDNRRTVTLRDALFVIEKERGHGGGKGSARGWT